VFVDVALAPISVDDKVPLDDLLVPTGVSRLFIWALCRFLSEYVTSGTTDDDYDETDAEVLEVLHTPRLMETYSMRRQMNLLVWCFSPERAPDVVLLGCALWRQLDIGTRVGADERFGIYYLSWPFGVSVPDEQSVLGRAAGQVAHVVMRALPRYDAYHLDTTARVVWIVANSLRDAGICRPTIWANAWYMMERRVEYDDTAWPTVAPMQRLVWAYSFLMCVRMRWDMDGRSNGISSEEWHGTYSRTSKYWTQVQDAFRDAGCDYRTCGLYWRAVVLAWSDATKEDEQNARRYCLQHDASVYPGHVYERVGCSLPATCVDPMCQKATGVVAADHSTYYDRPRSSLTRTRQYMELRQLIATWLLATDRHERAGRLQSTDALMLASMVDNLPYTTPDMSTRVRNPSTTSRVLRRLLGYE
jgi:hypothetical protein